MVYPFGRKATGDIEVSIIPFAIDTVTSRKFIDFFDESAVNFILGCILKMLSTRTLVFLLHALKGKIHLNIPST